MRNCLCQIKNSIERLSSTQNQVEDRISELEDKIYITAKSDEYIEKI
jgi:hypothetical protein